MQANFHANKHAPISTMEFSKKRGPMTDSARAELEEIFRVNAAPDPMKRSQIAAALNVTERSVKVWFQTRRKTRAAEIAQTDDPRIIAELASRIRAESTEANKQKSVAEAQNANRHQLSQIRDLSHKATSGPQATKKPDIARARFPTVPSKMPSSNVYNTAIMFKQPEQLVQMTPPLHVSGSQASVTSETHQAAGIKQELLFNELLGGDLFMNAQVLPESPMKSPPIQRQRPHRHSISFGSRPSSMTTKPLPLFDMETLPLPSSPEMDHTSFNVESAGLKSLPDLSNDSPIMQTIVQTPHKPQNQARRHSSAGIVSEKRGYETTGPDMIAKRLMPQIAFQSVTPLNDNVLIQTTQKLTNVDLI